MKIPVSGPILQEKVRTIATTLGLSGWLTKFKARHNILQLTINSERGDTDAMTVEEWNAKLPAIIEGYAPKDIYNMDETGVSYRGSPDKTLCVKGEQCTEGKESNQR
ncbi:tigger transposable element-derived protein 6-like [Limulus polyphemus]|uniref:Tigger transposable element-derived protein 6-like n=1 Tax=Limulus polyphemus TaxID=6850 RepID=A0ABM1BR54_LIMPO|nr:tigger transposable element-derived protein 6-like [Limulus polyphemus]